MLITPSSWGFPNASTITLSKIVWCHHRSTIMDMQSALEKHAELLHGGRPSSSRGCWLLARPAASDWGFLERAEAALGRLSWTLTILCFYLMLAKWARAQRAFMVASLLMLGRDRWSRLRSCKSCLMELCGGCGYTSFCRGSEVWLVQDLACGFFAVRRFEKSGLIDAAVSISPEPSKHVFPIGDEVAKWGPLATVPVAIDAREVCIFLATLTVAYPGSIFDWWIPHNVMAWLCLRGVGVSCLGYSFVSALWPLVLGRVGEVLLFRSLLGLAVSVFMCDVCVGLVLLLYVFTRFSPKNCTPSS
jgi:hypothetical protein